MALDWPQLRILIADDQRFILSLMFHMLKELGVRSENIHQGANGEEAMQVLRSLPLDLAICDVNMGPQNGLHLLKQIRTGQATVPATLPFIFLTAHSDAATVRLAAELDANGFLVKPVAKKDLRAKIEGVMGSKRPKNTNKNYDTVNVELSEAVKASAAMDGHQAALFEQAAKGGSSAAPQALPKAD
jgi:two-component system, OmpR family, response regulator